MDFAIPFFLLGTQSDKEEDRNDRVGTLPRNKSGEIGWLLELEKSESDSSNLEIYSVANKKPMQLRNKFEFGGKNSLCERKVCQVRDEDGGSVGTCFWECRTVMICLTLTEVV